MKRQRFFRKGFTAASFIIVCALALSTMGHAVAAEDRVAVLITGWGMPFGYNFEYAFHSHDYSRIGDMTEYEGQPCKIGHVGEFPYQSHLNFIPLGVLHEIEGAEWVYDSYGLYQYDSKNDLYTSSCPDSDPLTISSDEIPEETPVIPVAEWADRLGVLKYPLDPRDGENYTEGWYKIGDYDNRFPNGCGDILDEGPITYLRIAGMTGAWPIEDPNAYIPNEHTDRQDAYMKELMEEAFGDTIDLRFGFYTKVTGHTKHMTEVAEEFAEEGFTKMLIARETTDHNRYANEFVSGNYIKETLCELGTLDDFEIYQTRQIGRTPEFNSMNIINLRPFIEKYPEGSTIGMIYITRGLPWGADEPSGPNGRPHPWSKEVYFENAYLNYLSWKKALQAEFGDKYNLVFTKGGKESDLHEDNFYCLGINTEDQLSAYNGDTYFYNIRGRIEQAVADGLDKLIFAPCHWSMDNLDTIYRMKELSDLPLTPKADVNAEKYDYTHCEDDVGNEVACDSDDAVVEITGAPSFSHVEEEFGTSYYVVLRGTLERFGLYPQDEQIKILASQEVKKEDGGTIQVKNFFSSANGAKIDIPADPHPTWPEDFGPDNATLVTDPQHTYDCMWEDTVITIGHRTNPPAMTSIKAVGPAIHFGPYRTFFNRDVTITIPYNRLRSFGKEVKAYIYNHVTEDWDAVEVESAKNGLVTFKTQVLGLFMAGVEK